MTKDPTLDPEQVEPKVVEPKESDPEPSKKEPEEPQEPEEDFEAKYKELQSGLTPKLQRLAQLEKDKLTQDKVIEQLAGKQPTSTDESPVNIDEEIRDLDFDIKKYRDAGFKDDSYEVKGLLKQKRLAVHQKKIEQTNAKLSKSYDQNDELGKFLATHKDFDDFDGLATIIAEAEAEGDKLSVNRAYKIWKGDHTEKVASQKSKEALEQKKKSEKAKGADGGEIIEEKTEDEDMAAFRAEIAPIDTID